MTAVASYQAGRLKEAVEAQTAAVKAAPMDVGRRVLLFELLAFAGDLDRARRQLDALNLQAPEEIVAVNVCRELLDAETARRAVLHKGGEPLFFADPPDHVRLRLEALTALREGRPADAGRLLAEADAAALPRAGTLDDRSFSLLRDCDDRFGGVLEVFARGKYYWVPMEQVVSLTIAPPKYPRDVLWAVAQLETFDAVGQVFLPALYPDSHLADGDAAEDGTDGGGLDALRLGRATDWRETADGPVVGVGARLFLVEDDVVALLDWRKLELGLAVDPDEVPPPEA
ncbi:MAG: type VI secretion system accessory protein TagJ [Planctomycetia bacterium]